MNATPLPLSHRRRVDLISLAAGPVAFLLALPLLASGPIPDRPGLIVLALTAILSAVSGGAAISKGLWTMPEPALVAARLGARAGLLTALLAAGMTVLAAVLSGAPRLWLIGLAAPLCVLPGALAGIAGASLAMSSPASVSEGGSPESPVEELTEPFAGPSLLSIGVVALALSGFFSPLYLRSWRQYFPPPQQPATPPAPDAAKAKPEQQLAPPKPVFSYVPSPDLGKTPPLLWRISEQKTLPDIAGDKCIALSHDGRFLAGLASNGVVLIDLHSLETKCRWNVSEGVQALAFSPDDQQLVYMTSQPPRVGVLRIAGSRVLALPQPRKRLIPDTPPLWSGATTVTFRTPGGPPLALDLDLLEIDPIATPEEWSAESAEERAAWTLDGPADFAQSDVWSLRPLQWTSACELPEVEGVSNGWPEEHQMTLGIDSPKGGGSLVFPAVDLQMGDRVLASPDGSKFVRCRNESVVVFYFKPGILVPSDRWTVPMPHPPEGLDEMPAAGVVEEKRLCAFAYRPLTNPLNDKVIGPDRSRVLATLRLVSWDDRTAVFATELQSADLPDDMVVADPHVWQGTRPELLSFSGRHRWWAKAAPHKEPVDTAGLPALKRQPIVQTKWSGGALRLVNQSDPTPPLVDRLPERPDRDNRPSSYGSPAEIAAVQKFIQAHHEKARRGDVRGLASDYADRVQFLSHGAVTRAFIEKEEFNYHNEHSRVDENVVSVIEVKFLSPQLAQARYLLNSTTTLRATGAVSVHNIRLILDIQLNDGRIEITRQRAEK